MNLQKKMWLAACGLPMLTIGALNAQNKSATELNSVNTEVNYQQLLTAEKSSFRKNLGQWSSEILYETHNNGSAIRFLENGVSYAVTREMENPPLNGAEQLTSLDKMELLVWNTVFEGADFSNGILSQGEQISNTNYLKGNEPEKWVIHVPDYSMITYDDIYNDIDLKYYKSDGQLKYDFVVGENGKVSTIEMRFDGVEGIDINRAGQIEIMTPWGVLIEEKPYSFQLIEGKVVEVNVIYDQLSSSSVGFKVIGKYKKSLPLIIDPVVLQWATFIGAKGDGYIRGIRVDKKGKVYGTGYYGGNFPTTPGVYGAGNFGDKDLFAFKLSEDGTTLEYSTYVGGKKLDDGFAAAVNDKEELHLTGWTLSSDYPVFNQYSGDKTGYDVYVSKLKADGTGFVFSTYLGGDKGEKGLGIAVGPNDDVFVTGQTGSANFPKKNAAPNPTGDKDNWFVVRLKGTGNTMVYSTVIGGPNRDYAKGITVDKMGNAYVTGTMGIDFPVSAGAYSSGATSGVGAIKLNPSGNNVVYSSIIGKGGGLAIDADDNGNAYVSGWTTDGAYPTTSGAYQTTLAGLGSHTYYWYQGEGIVTKLSSDGSSLVYSTFLGGQDDDRIGGIRVNKNGEAFVSGTTWSRNFPVTTCGIQQSLVAKSEAFVSKFSADGSSLDYSTYIGGMGDDYWSSMDLREFGDCGQEVVATITSHSGDFPTTNGAYQKDHPYGPSMGSDCPAIWKLKPVITPKFKSAGGGCNIPVSFTDQTFGDCIWKSGAWNPTSWQWNFGDGSTSSSQNPSHLFPGPGSYQVTLVVGCPADSITQTIVVPGPFNDFDLGPDVSKCQGPLSELLDAGKGG